MKKEDSITARLFTVIKPVIESLDLSLWDIEFKKEGASWFLRVYIDKDGGVTIDDCEAASRALDPVLDEADIIEQSYYLEVSSPGVERTLKAEEHFRHYMGSRIALKLYKAINGQKEFEGELCGYKDGAVSLKVNETEYTFNDSDIANVKLKVF